MAEQRRPENVALYKVLFDLVVRGLQGLGSLPGRLKRKPVSTAKSTGWVEDSTNIEYTIIPGGCIRLPKKTIKTYD